MMEEQDITQGAHSPIVGKGVLGQKKKGQSTFIEQLFVPGTVLSPTLSPLSLITNPGVERECYHPILKMRKLSFREIA